MREVCYQARVRIPPSFAMKGRIPPSFAMTAGRIPPLPVRLSSEKYCISYIKEFYAACPLPMRALVWETRTRDSFHFLPHLPLPQTWSALNPKLNRDTTPSPPPCLTTGSLTLNGTTRHGSGVDVLRCCIGSSLKTATTVCRIGTKTTSSNSTRFSKWLEWPV